MRSGIAARAAVRMGYRNVWRYPAGYKGWLQSTGKSQEGTEFKGPVGGDMFPHVELSVLKGDWDRPYLGLPRDARFFTLAQAAPRYLVVDVYNELCTFCMKQMTVYDRVARELGRNSEEPELVRLIGLGMGQTRRGAARMRMEKDLAYPLFADDKKEAFRNLGGPLLPALYLLRKEEGGRRIVRFEPGHDGGVQETMDWIRLGIAAGEGP